MWKRYIGLATIVITIATMTPKQAEAFDFTGGSVWQNRVGPALAFGIGLNGCGDGVCRRDWGTRYSIGGIVGFHYRLIPNLVIFGDIHTGHIPVDYDYPQWDINKDNGFVFEITAGAELHVPITGWVAPYVGFGMGWAYIGSWLHTDNTDIHDRFTGFDFQVRIGADFFPFSQVANLSIGPALFMSFPAWIRACREQDGDQDCEEPDNFVPENRRDDLPKLVFIGILGKYWF